MIYLKTESANMTSNIAQLNHVNNELDALEILSKKKTKTNEMLLFFIHSCYLVGLLVSVYTAGQWRMAAVIFSLFWVLGSFARNAGAV